MGMFDTIAWADSVPTSPEMDELGLNKRDWEFQTKDLDSALDLYSVQDGRLYIQKYRKTEWVEGDPKGESLMDKLGHLNREEPYWEFVPKTATVAMYDYRQNVQGKWDCIIDYQVIFIDGVVSSVKLEKFEKRSNEERLRLDAEWQAEIEYVNSRWYNRFFFHTRPYLFMTKYLRAGLFSLADSIYRFANKL